MTCRFCKSEKMEQGLGLYAEYLKCVDCKMYEPKKYEEHNTVILPDDPNDANICEGCS